MRRTREDVARPYPSVFMESHHDNPQFIDLDGWIFPRSGVAFVWTLAAERRAQDES